MTLVKTSLLNGIAVIVKMLTLLGINKILAIYVGPAGYAAIGQFQNAVQVITTFASGAINTGVTKYTAQYHDDETQQIKVWQTAGTIALISSILTALIIAIFNRQLARWFLKNESYGGVFLWFSATLVLFVFNAMLLAILNGKKEIGRFVVANIAGSVFALVVTFWLTSIWGLYGALVGLAVFQSLTFLVTVFLLRGANWFKFRYLFGRLDKDIAKNLGKYTLMALTSAACVPLSQIYIRNYIGENIGWSSAGYWEGMTRLSSAYLLLITTSLSVYYLPRLSEIQFRSELVREVVKGYKVVLPATVIFSLCIYLLRDQIILTLFTKDFFPMRSLFAWQLIGDTLKIGSWVISYLMLGKAMFRLFISTEVIFSATFVLLSIALLNKFGFQGVTIAYAINYLLYWICVAYLVNKKIL